MFIWTPETLGNSAKKMFVIKFIHLHSLTKIASHAIHDSMVGKPLCHHHIYLFKFKKYIYKYKFIHNNNSFVLLSLCHHMISKNGFTFNVKIHMNRTTLSSTLSRDFYTSTFARNPLTAATSNYFDTLIVIRY